LQNGQRAGGDRRRVGDAHFDRRTGGDQRWLGADRPFVRAGFAGYDTTLTQGGDEVDLLRRLKRQGRIAWDANNAVVTSSRRMNQGLLYTLVVSFGYYYGWSYVLSRLSSRPVVGGAPAIRREHAVQVRRRRRRWRVGATVVALGLAGVLRVRSAGALSRSERV
jgi:hypothetical protein